MCNAVCSTHIQYRKALAYLPYSRSGTSLLRGIRELEVFPAVILGRSALDKNLLIRIEQTLVSGIGLKALADNILESRKYEVR